MLKALKRRSIISGMHLCTAFCTSLRADPH